MPDLKFGAQLAITDKLFNEDFGYLMPSLSLTPTRINRKNELKFPGQPALLVKKYFATECLKITSKQLNVEPPGPDLSLRGSIIQIYIWEPDTGRI
jgi:hypothetical protein